MDAVEQMEILIETGYKCITYAYEGQFCTLIFSRDGVTKEKEIKIKRGTSDYLNANMYLKTLGKKSLR